MGWVGGLTALPLASLSGSRMPWTTSTGPLNLAMSSLVERGVGKRPPEANTPRAPGSQLSRTMLLTRRGPTYCLFFLGGGGGEKIG